MKKIYTYIISGVVSVLSFTACDLDTQPTNYVDAEFVFTTTKDAENVLNGTWYALMETFNSYANPGYGSFLRASDAMGNDVVMNRNYGFYSHYNLSAIYSKGGTNSLSWNLSYKVINNVNNVIAKVDDTEGTQKDKETVKAQALALRGFMYLHLASVYSFAIDKDPNAVCVPIYLKPTTSGTVGEPASSVSEVYAQSLSDLKEALNLMPADYKRLSKYKIDKQVVLGILSRATLYSKDWEGAKKYSDELLALNNYLMNEEEYTSGFNSIDNKEWIWGHPQTAEQQDASYQFHFLDTTSEGTYYYSFNADPFFKDLFNDGDYRKGMISWRPNPKTDPTKISEAWLRYAKFKFRNDYTADIVLMRVSEIFLINAEAKARLNDGDAINKLNEVKTARNAILASGLSGQALIDEIWIERRKELFGEGFALTDIIRNQQKVVRNAYTVETVDYTFTNKEGAQQTVKLKPIGHHTMQFPDESNFSENSKYYLYRITDLEERSNKNIYTKYPKLAIYK